MAELTRNRLYLLGHRIGYSISPELHAEALSVDPRNPSYELLDVPPADFPGRVEEALRVDTTLGLNVTTPYKEAVIPLLDGVTERAETIGAVNTIFRGNDGWLGDNTDAPAFRQTLREAAKGVHWERSLVLGSGGAARSVSYTLLDSRFCERSLIVCSRNRTTAARLRTDLDPLGQTLSTTDWSQRGKLTRGALVVNATPAGTGGSPTPLRSAELGSAELVYDLVYSPSPTPLVTAARIAGVRARSGMGMLKKQAELSRRLWGISHRSV